MNDTKSVYFQKSEDTAIINNETGEVLSESHSHTEHAKIPAEPPFIKLYLDCLAKFNDIQISLNPILAEMLKRASYADEEIENGGFVLYLNKPLKTVIAKKCKVSLNRVEHALTEFVKRGYIYRIGVGSYQFNANLFGKGSWKDINNIRNIQAEFDFGAGTVVAKIVRDEEEAINKATDEIANKSFEELTELQKKKRYEELLDYIPHELWSETDQAIANEELYEFIYSGFMTTSKNMIMSMLECGKSFEEIAENTGYPFEKIAEFQELMLYEQEKQAEKERRAEQEKKETQSDET